MKFSNLLGMLIVISVILTSCQKDDPIIDVQLETSKITNLFAPGDVRDHQTGEIIEENEFVYFDFSSGQSVEQTSEWDIAFKGTTIIVNGGVSGSGNVSAALVNATLDEVVEAPSDELFSQDTDIAFAIPRGSGNGWYDYNPINHLITPIPGRIIVVKTFEGNYVKFEILSYYKDAPENPDPLTDLGDYFTFNYVYQQNGTKQF